LGGEIILKILKLTSVNDKYLSLDNGNTMQTGEACGQQQTSAITIPKLLHSNDRLE